MEFSLIKPFVELASQYGISTVIAFVFLFYFIKTSQNQIKLILEELSEIKQLSTKRVLEKQQAISVFRAILSEHIRKKLEIAKNRLIANNLKTRPAQIKSYLSVEFNRITQEEVAVLDGFITTAGSMGDILKEILEQDQWNKFMGLIYPIFFGDGTTEQKMEDMGALMNQIVNNMIQLLESKLK